MKRISKSAFRAKCRTSFFKSFGRQESGIWIAYCQICGFELLSDYADAAHKETAGMGGPISRDVPENIVVVHGHRCGPRNCHRWVDATDERRKMLKKAWASSVVGGVVIWPEALRKSLYLYLKTGIDPEMGP